MSLVTRGWQERNLRAVLSIRTHRRQQFSRPEPERELVRPTLLRNTGVGGAADWYRIRREMRSAELDASAKREEGRTSSKVTVVDERMGIVVQAVVGYGAVGAEDAVAGESWEWEEDKGESE